MRYEVFHVPTDYALTDDDGAPLDEGWYWWYVQPGCLPDSDASGPFGTEDEATENAEEDMAEFAYWDDVDRRVDEAGGK
jgi:hypothetical protein